MNVKTKIANFEAHNEALRLAALSTSPTRKDFDTLSDATSTTMASISRKIRIQRAVSNSPLRQEQHQPQISPAVGSLAERRKSRLQRQRGQKLAIPKTEPATNNVTKIEESNSRSSNSRSSLSLPLLQNSAPEVSSTQLPAPRRRPKPSPETNLKIQPQQRRLVQAMSAESADELMFGREEDGEVRLSPDRRLSPSRAVKVHRMQRMKHQEEVPKRRTKATPRTPRITTPITDDNDGSYTSILTRSPMDQTDDEATLTSVRQIMKSDSQQPILDPPKPVMMRTTSSSSYDTDADSVQRPLNTNMGAFLRGSHSTVVLRKSNSYRQDDDDRTFDYGDRDDDDSHESVPPVQRKAPERRAKVEKVRDTGFVDSGEVNSPLITSHDMEYYRQNLDTPVAKTAAGVVVAATVGGIMLGPVGLLVGAAAVGLGIGILQIPEEQRDHVKVKAAKAVKRAHDSAVSASETFSSACAAACNGTAAGSQIPSEMKQCFTPPEMQEVGVETEDDSKDDDIKDVSSHKGPKGENSNVNKKAPGLISTEGRKTAASPAHSKIGKRRPAFMRSARITPVNQIHSIEPSSQPKAWLDVMASVNTTLDEKNEAMEEIIILAKDKRHARFFLEEGILDSLMWILTKYLERAPRKQEDLGEFTHAKLAATCCITLGKAYCAAIHTGGDLLLMSLYERGTVPEERQLAQLLYEVPHHVLVAKTASDQGFVLKQVSMPQAEELARSIQALADGQRPPPQ